MADPITSTAPAVSSTSAPFVTEGFHHVTMVSRDAQRTQELTSVEHRGSIRYPARHVVRGRASICSLP